MTSTALLDAQTTTTSRPHNPAAAFVRRLLRNKLAVAGLVIIGVLLLAVPAAPFITRQQPDANGIWKAYPRESKAPPSADHWFGTDNLGRDIFSMIVYGARISLRVGVVSVGLAIIIGAFLGAVAGYIGGWPDLLIMRVMDVMLAFPSILLALSIVYVLGPGLLNVMLAVGTISIPTYARIVRASVISESTRDYVTASEALGMNRWAILFRHVFPNSLSPLIVAASLGIGTAILDAAGLGFLGLGAQPPLPEWGLMLSRNRQFIFAGPWMVIFPGLAIMFTVLGFNLLGDGLRDALDPRLSNVGIKAE